MDKKTGKSKRLIKAKVNEIKTKLKGNQHEINTDAAAGAAGAAAGAAAAASAAASRETTVKTVL